MGNLVVMDDISDLLNELHKKYKAEEIARHFGRERKWFYLHKQGFNYVLNTDFIAGLRHYGYDLKLVRWERKNDKST